MTSSWGTHTVAGQCETERKALDCIQERFSRHFFHTRWNSYYTKMEFNDLKKVFLFTYEDIAFCRSYPYNHEFWICKKAWLYLFSKIIYLVNVNIWDTIKIILIFMSMRAKQKECIAFHSESFLKWKTPTRRAWELNELALQQVLLMVSRFKFRAFDTKKKGYHFTRQFLSLNS